jgi:hypothetical protein
MPTAGDAEAPRQYLFIVTRDRPDLLSRARETFGSHPGIEIVADRRVAERRRSTGAQGVERRRTDRRRAATPEVDSRAHPTRLARKHVPTYAELKAENERLRQEVQALEASLLALTAASAIRRTTDCLVRVAHDVHGGASQ